MVEEQKGEGDINGVLCNPERLRIVVSLKKEPMHLNELSRRLEIERGLIAYHAKILSSHGYLDGQYETIDAGNAKGHAVRKLTVTEKGEQKLNALIDALKDA